MRRQRYTSITSDLTHKQFKRLEALLPACKAGGRPREVDLYEVMCAILYVLQNGCTCLGQNSTSRACPLAQSSS
jgi:putative transposase